jgi:hypothetical protein
MSYEGLAARLTNAGCPIQASAIYKIEKADPPRRITVDELVAFSQVFAIPIERLLLPPEVAESEQLMDLLVEWEVTRGKSHRAKEREDAAWSALRDYVDGHPELTDTLEGAMRSWAESYFDPEQQEGAVNYWMWEMTRSEEWLDRWNRLRADRDL